VSVTGWWIAGPLLAIGLAALASVTFAIAACVLASRRYRDPAGWCHCSHPEQAHRHYRPGTDCGQCQCPRFRPADWDQAYDRELGKLRP
jgi:hypothetical protein